MKARLGSNGFLLALLTCVMLLASATSASAGNYNVYQCHENYGYANSGWTSGANGFYGGLHGCTDEFSMAATNFGDGEFLWWRSPLLPAKLTISTLSYKANSAEGTINPTILNAFMCTGSAVASGPYPCDSYTDIVHMPSEVFAGATHILNCSAPASTSTCKMAGFGLRRPGGYGPANGWFGFRNVVATINDHAAPTAWQPYGGSLRSNTTVLPVAGHHWNRGARTASFDARDASESGIKQIRMYFDNDPGNGLFSQSFDQNCNYANWQPCPIWPAVQPTIDTTKFQDGSHTVTNRATDAGDNVTDATVTFKVDNTDPSTPADKSGDGDGLQGYGATNDFDISWTNGVETTETSTQSGISHVVLDLEPVNPGGTNPAPLVIPVGGSASGVSATIDSLSGVTLPEQAGYRYGVGLRDLAGNWSGNVSVDGNNNPTGVNIDPEDSSALTWNNQPPPAPSMQNNDWVSEAQLLEGYSQQWNVAIPQGGGQVCGYATSISPNQTDDAGTTINLHGAVDSWELPSDLSEGSHWVHIRSIGCNLLPAASTASSEVKVDRTDPVSSFAGVTAGKWYKDGSVVAIGATDELSGMAPAASGDPFDFGAHLDYSINAVSPVEPARGGEAQLPISGEGQKELRFAAVDVAGNRNDDTVVNFGIDASNPTGYLQATDPETPTLIRAPLADVVSGLETAIIEVRPEAGGDWTPLPTGLADLSGAAVAGNPTSAMASARFPDTTLPEGRYLVRVRTYDQADNALVTDRDKQGRPFIVDSGQMREHVGLSATLFKAKRTCKKKRGVKCVKKARGKVVFLGGKSNLTVGFKRGAVVQGFLVDASTKALARQPIEIYTQAKGREEVLAGTTATRPDGSYAFKLRPGVSRSVRVYFPGTETRRDTSERVTLGTGAKLKLRVSKKHARTGQTVTFSGTVTSFDGAVPASGKIIALQFYTAKKWRPAVAIARTDAKGRFKVKYKFDGGGNKARIVFRVMAPAEDGWGHATSNSRRITMKLN